MKLIRFLICLFTILGISQIGKADQQVGLIGNQVTVYKGPWNNLTPSGGVRHYTIKNIPKSYQLLLQITSFDASATSVNLTNLYCSIDPTVVDFDTAANIGKFANVTFSANGVTSASALISMAGGQVFNSGNVITTPTLPCTSITLEFANATQVGSTVEVVARFSDLAVGQTGVNGGIGTGAITGQVQGVIATGTNGTSVNPLVDGALQPAINASTFSLGIDTFAVGLPSTILASQPTFTTLQNPPRPSSLGGYGIAVIANNNFSVSKVLNAPFSCITGANPCATSNNPAMASAALSSNSANSLSYTYTSTNAGCSPGPCVQFGHFLDFGSIPTSTRNGSASNNVTTIGTGSNTLAGSTILLSVECSTTACSIAPSDTQSMTWKQVATSSSTDASTKGLTTWIAGPTTAAAESVTYNVASGTIQGGAIVELVGILPANLNQPIIPFQGDSSGRAVTASDALGANLFSCTVTITTNTTTQCQALTTSSRVYVTDIQINTTTAGTATTIGVVDGTGANCVTGQANLSAIKYPNTSIAITNVLGVHTPLGAPLSTAVCVQQAGTTPGTSVVELRGYIAP